MDYMRLSTIQEALRYWRQCLEGADLSQEVAWKILALGANEHFEEWYEDLADDDFIALYENASEIEIHNGDDVHIASLWREISEHLKILEKRYL